MKKIWRALTFNLSQALYPLISDLYGIFEDLASSKYISAGTIRNISQNLYLIISACMLFALGIKLISAIVNPDLLDDKKKGAKQTFFRCVTAVFLIVLVPMGFNKMYEWQEQIVNDHVVEKLILGMDVSDDSNRPGQILAAYAFYSFCQPNETVSSESISEYYNKTITEDIYYIDDLDDAITSKTDGKWDLNYHPILSPAVGFFMVYEMVVLCIDIALRGLKLALLQLITPIILCAYVIMGDDVLQKWAKEVFSTFVLVFVKIALVAFMVFGLSIIPDFFNNNNLNITVIDDNHPIKNFLKLGIIRTFFIIGLLQLIKLLPDILNKIFGTNFKNRGGIRGRLGEMQGVGEMAQKAWDKIKTAGVKLGATAALLSSPAGWAAAAAGGTLAYGWKKGIKWGPQIGNAGPTRDSAFGRGLRKFGAGAKAIGTGLTTKGGITKSIQEGQKKYNESSVSYDNKAARDDKISADIRDAFKLNKGGRIDDVEKAMVNKEFAKASRIAKETWANRENILQNLRLGDKKEAATKGMVDAKHRVAEVNSVDSTYKALLSDLDEMISDTTKDNATIQKLKDIKGSFVTKRLSTTGVANALVDLRAETGQVSVGEINKWNADYTKFDGAVANSTNLGSLGQLIKTHSDGSHSAVVSDIGREVETAATELSGAEADYKRELEHASDKEKTRMESFVSKAEQVSTSVIDTNKKNVSYSTSDNSKGDTEPLGGSSSTQSSKTDPYEGYGPSSTPSYGDYDGSNDYYNNGSSSGSNNTNNNNSPVNNSNNIGSSDNSQSGGTTVINNNYNNSGSNESIDVKLDTSSLNGKLDDINKSIGNMSSDIAKEIGKQGEALRSDINTLNKNTKDVKKSIDNNTDALDNINKDE